MLFSNCWNQSFSTIDRWEMFQKVVSKHEIQLLHFSTENHSRCCSLEWLKAITAYFYPLDAVHSAWCNEDWTQTYLDLNTNTARLRRNIQWLLAWRAIDLWHLSITTQRSPLSILYGERHSTQRTTSLFPSRNYLFARFNSAVNRASLPPLKLWNSIKSR